MNCGTAKNFSAIPSDNMKEDIFNITYRCSNNISSLFKCENTILPSDYRNTVAAVTCSGNVTQYLLAIRRLVYYSWFISVHLLATNLKCSFFLCFVVTTADHISANLTKGCWGHVNVCVGNKCGGVCKDSWTQKMSAMLCENLGCGKPIQSIMNQEYFQEVIITSLYTTTYTRNLNQGIVIMKNDSDCIKNPAYVVCSGNV